MNRVGRTLSLTDVEIIVEKFVVEIDLVAATEGYDEESKRNIVTNLLSDVLNDVQENGIRDITLEEAGKVLGTVKVTHD